MVAGGVTDARDNDLVEQIGSEESLLVQKSL